MFQNMNMGNNPPNNQNNNNQQQQQQPQQQQPNPFMMFNPNMMGMMGNMGGMGMGGMGQQQQQQQNVQPEILYRNQLSQLNSMGFNDADANIQALVACGGNVQAAIDRLLNSGN